MTTAEKWAEAPTVPPLAFSSFTGIKDNAPKMGRLPWPALCVRLTTHKPLAKKEDGQAWSPATYPAGATRGIAHVDTVTAFVADVDGGAAPAELMPRWAGLTWALHSSFSSTPDNPKWRAVFPLAAPVPASEWPAVWRRLNAALMDGKGDPACKDAARLYYLPAHPDDHESAQHAFADIGEGGAPVNPCDLAAYPEPPQEETARAYAEAIHRRGPARGANESEAGKPGDDYNRRAQPADVLALLIGAGWRMDRMRGEVIHLTRPGKAKGLSGTIGYVGEGGNVFYCFTSSGAPFEANVGYSPFAVYAATKCGGLAPESFTDAARQLGAAGYGSQSVVYDPDKSNLFKKLQAPIGRGGEGSNERERGSTNPLYISNELNKLNKSENEANPPPSDPGEPWEGEPLPMGTESLPAFPVHCLPPVLGAFAEAVAAEVGTAVDLPAVQLLAAVAAAAQKRVAVMGKPGHVEPVTLWAVSIAPPGARKSSVLSKIRKPFASIEAADNENNAPLIEAYLSDERVARQRLANAERLAAADKPESGAAEKVRTERDALASIAPVRAKRLMVDDATPEAVAALLSENGGRLAVFDAEGTTFGHMTGRYSEKVAIEVYLKSHSGEDFTQDRAGKERRAVIVRGASLTIGCAIQPEILTGLRKRKELTGVGVLARCLFSFSDTDPAADEYLSPAVPDAVAANYRRLIGDLLDLPPSNDNGDDGERLPWTIGLAPGALTAFTDFYRDNRKDSQDDPELLQQWRAKLHGATLRLAGVLHLALCGKAGAEREISAETMADAVQIARYFLAHARVALAKVREDEATEGAGRIIGWVKRNRKKAASPAGLSTGELLRQLRTFDGQEELNAALALLAVRGYARQLAPEEKPEGTAGRKPAARWEFHPSLTDTGEDVY